jgi:oleandomycin transport system ATP-binding protein
VIFLDEPTTGLDPAKREDMWDVVRSLVSDGSTVLLTTQYLEEADALADEITVMDHGRAISGHTPEDDGRGTVTVRVEGDDVLPDVVARLSAAGIAVEEFSLHLPSLDEVFFTLTGTRSYDSDEKALV